MSHAIACGLFYCYSSNPSALYTAAVLDKHIASRDVCEEKIGQLMVASGVPEEIPLQIIQVGVDFSEIPDGYSEDLFHLDLATSSIKDHLNKNSHNQLFRKYKILFANDLILSEREWSIFMSDIREVGVASSWETLRFLYNIQYPEESIVETPSTFTYFIANVPGNVNGWSTKATDVVGGDVVGRGVLYQTASIETIETSAHELGHGLNLDHVFMEDGKLGRIPRGDCDCGNTCGIMDYVNYSMPKPRVTFFYYEWISNLYK